MKQSGQANRGKPFEDFLLFVHEAYQKQGVAVVHKVPTEFIPLRDRTGKVTGVKVERKSCVDYLGRYYSVPVAVEAKHTEADSIRWDRVEEHQAAYLDDFTANSQATGIVLVSFRLQRFFAVPWQAWRVGREIWEKGAGRQPHWTTSLEPGKSIKIEPGENEQTMTCAVYGGTLWAPPRRASVKAEELPPEWEIRPGGRTGLPYLEIIEEWRNRAHG